MAFTLDIYARVKHPRRRYDGSSGAPRSGLRTWLGATDTSRQTTPHAAPGHRGSRLSHRAGAARTPRLAARPGVFSARVVCSVRRSYFRDFGARLVALRQPVHGRPASRGGFQGRPCIARDPPAKPSFPCVPPPGERYRIDPLGDSLVRLVTTDKAEATPCGDRARRTRPWWTRGEALRSEPSFAGTVSRWRIDRRRSARYVVAKSDQLKPQPQDRRRRSAANFEPASACSWTLLRVGSLV